MANSNFADFVRELFAPWATVVVRPMFGGAGVYRDGLMFALLADDRIFLKTSDNTKPNFEAAGSTPFIFQPKSGPAMTMSYYLMPDAAYDDPDALNQWANLGWQAALAGKVKKAAKKVKIQHRQRPHRY